MTTREQIQITSLQKIIQTLNLKLVALEEEKKNLEERLRASEKRFSSENPDAAKNLLSKMFEIAEDTYMEGFRKKLERVNNTPSRIDEDIEKVQKFEQEGRKVRDEIKKEIAMKSPEQKNKIIESKRDGFYQSRQDIMKKTLEDSKKEQKRKKANLVKQEKVIEKTDLDKDYESSDRQIFNELAEQLGPVTKEDKDHAKEILLTKETVKKEQRIVSLKTPSIKEKKNGKARKTKGK
jgi:hypothetical protein